MADRKGPAKPRPEKPAEKRQPGEPPKERKKAKFKPEDVTPEIPLAVAAAMQPASDDDVDPDFERLVAALRVNRRRLLRLPGVVAVDVGYRIRDGVYLDELALRVHVERKLPARYFKEHPWELLSKNKDFDLKISSEPCFGQDQEIVEPDIIEAVYHPAGLPPPRPGTVVETPVDASQINRRRRIDPLVGGISIGSANAAFGTLGALVWDKTDGSVCILSNWHVLGGHSHAEPGTACLQPGPFDRGRASDVVARLKRWSFDSQTDAAIAELVGSRHYCAGEILDLPRPIFDTDNPHLGMKLIKSGRSTGRVEGFVDGLYFSSAIEYSNDITQIFEDQIHIAPLDPNKRISEPGDSGAVWVSEETANAVGLHFAGDLLRSAFGEYALANPMSLVADRLNFSFRPVFLEIRDEGVISLDPTTRIDFDNGRRRINPEDRAAGSGHETGDQVRIPPGGQ